MATKRRKGIFLADEARKKQDESWLGKLLAGDHEAFAEFVEKYQQRVFMCCRLLGLREDEIEDVASETFLAAYKGLRQYSGKAQLSTWLWAIAYRQAVSYLRKNRRENQLLPAIRLAGEAEPENLITGSREQEPTAAIQGKEIEKIVWQAVEQLPRLWKMAIILHYREGKGIADIAKIMRTRENTIKTYLFRGREMLKKILAATFGEDFDVGR